MKRLKHALAAVALAATPLISNAVVISNWTSNDASTGNFIVTITNAAGGDLDVNVNVSPWNAEALGFFLDLGNVNIVNPALSNVSPAGQVSIFDTDTTDDDCGTGCNLSGLALPPGTEWEYVVRLGTTGFNGIQSFSFRLGANAALDESMVQVVGMRAQQLCAPGSTLPTGNCNDSDKAWGAPNPPGRVPLPGTLALLGLGLVGLAGLRRIAR